MDLRISLIFKRNKDNPCYRCNQNKSVIQTIICGKIKLFESQIIWIEGFRGL